MPLLRKPEAACVIIALLALSCGRATAPRLMLHPGQIVADGYDTATLAIESNAGLAPAVSLVTNAHSATIGAITGGGRHWEVSLRAGVLPGRVRLRITFPRAPAAETQLEVLPFWRDSAADGTPDFLRLQDDRDRQEFRRWFTKLAEMQYFQPPSARPVEINDCAALIRYAYREALRTQGAIAKYRYPYTPLGAALFRVRPGAFQPDDLTDGAFAQFADAKTLLRLNTNLVGRLLPAAMPGDLLFFRQEAGAERFHSMIYLGKSQVQNDDRRYILYHTGPSDSDPGEMRRPTVEELMQFPRTEWRPLTGNPRFLGVFRWNILRQEIDTLPK